VACSEGKLYMCMVCEREVRLLYATAAQKCKQYRQSPEWNERIDLIVDRVPSDHRNYGPKGARVIESGGSQLGRMEAVSHGLIKRVITTQSENKVKTI
jgi:hypothetical protein